MRRSRCRDAKAHRRRPSCPSIDDPGIRDQVFQRRYYAVPNRHLWRPTQRLDSAAIKKDERIVPNPAALAAGVGKLRLQLKPLANPADRLVDLAILALSKIEDIDAASGTFDCDQDRIDAVLNIKIGFALLAISKHLKPRRIGQQLLIEIKHMAVGVAFAQDGNEAEDKPLKAETLAIGGDQAFRRYFGVAIQRRLDRERRVLRRRKYRGL